MDERETFNLTKFDDTNFVLWKYGVSFMLESQDLMEIYWGDGHATRQGDKVERMVEMEEASVKDVCNSAKFSGLVAAHKFG